MNKFFTENLPWKIASLVVATMLWLFVINTQNPTQPQEISGIKVQITGEDILTENGYELTNKAEILNQNFKVVVSGPRLEVDKLLRNPSAITATLNLTEYEDDLIRDSISYTNINYVVRINADGNSVSIKDKKPQVTKVLIDKIDSKEQKVTYEIAEDITSHHTLLGDGKPIISPEKVIITGPKSELDRVAEAKVLIKSEDFSAEQLVNNLPIKLYDIDGSIITGLKLSNETAEVKLPIGSEKVVPVEVSFTGEMPEGYILTKVDTDVQNVTIVGKSEVLAGISKIELEPIDLSKITESRLLQVQMILPDGVVSLEKDTVSVSLQISEENTLNYPMLMSELNLTVIGIGEGLTYEILTPSINIELSGLSDDLILTEKSDIEATLDLSNYKEGEYTLPLTITAPENIRVKNNPINIKVSIKALEDTTPSPSPGEDGDVADGGSDNENTEETPETDGNTSNEEDIA
ncbi:MAG: hypothetical protein J6F30_10930 [Cellulosilyticum sp.]|nr:hypothetical protein [Cellulosilyticum sp.]